MTLQELMQDSSYTVLSGDMTRPVAGVAYDSRRTVRDGLFVALTGAQSDGHDFIFKAYERGARAFLTEYPLKDPERYPGAVFVRTPSTRQALARLSARWYGFPDRKMTLVGITGTKGKTSTTFLLSAICRAAGIPAGVIGTTGIYYGGEFHTAVNTTPESFELHGLFDRMARKGCRVVLMEVSSQGFKQHRTLGIQFDIGVFLNLSADHIGPAEHQSFGEYAYYKSRLFEQCDAAVVCADSPFTPYIVEPFSGQALTFGIDAGELRAREIRPERDGSRLSVSFALNKGGRLGVSMPGKYSVYNALAAVGTARSLQIDEAAIKEGLRAAVVPGRVEPVETGAAFSVLIDYAHNAVSMQNLLCAVRDYAPRRILCVFGCGGNRAKARRLDMGAAAGRLCDLSVLTSDNPRFEKTDAIIADIVEGIKPAGGRYEIVPDRAEAIRFALSQAGEGDIVLIVGKGHQKYEEVGGVKYPFDDRAVVRAYCKG